MCPTTSPRRLVSIPYSNSGRSNEIGLFATFEQKGLNPLFKFGEVKQKKSRPGAGYHRLNPLFKFGEVKRKDWFEDGGAIVSQSPIQIRGGQTLLR